MLNRTRSRDIRHLVSSNAVLPITNYVDCMTNSHTQQKQQCTECVNDKQIIMLQQRREREKRQRMQEGERLKKEQKERDQKERQFRQLQKTKLRLDISSYVEKQQLIKNKQKSDKDEKNKMQRSMYEKDMRQYEEQQRREKREQSEKKEQLRKNLEEQLRSSSQLRNTKQRSESMDMSKLVQQKKRQDRENQQRYREQLDNLKRYREELKSGERSTEISRQKLRLNILKIKQEEKHEEQLKKKYEIVKRGSNAQAENLKVAEQKKINLKKTKEKENLADRQRLQQSGVPKRKVCIELQQAMLQQLQIDKENSRVASLRKRMVESAVQPVVKEVSSFVCCSGCNRTKRLSFVN